MTRAADTRRIRARAKRWKAWKLEQIGDNPTDLAGYKEVARKEGLTLPELADRIRKNLGWYRSYFAGQLRSLRRESAHMRPYHREQVIRWLPVLRIGRQVVQELTEAGL